mmetsp:Transcript_13121/g.21278  ORF Transcript_13121/g.21278 Transcript_13121/m.21278 type:complete len:111 (+) Transcript_13121:755-1087(+)
MASYVGVRGVASSFNGSNFGPNHQRPVAVCNHFVVIRKTVYMIFMPLKLLTNVVLTRENVDKMKGIVNTMDNARTAWNVTINIVSGMGLIMERIPKSVVACGPLHQYKNI